MQARHFLLLQGPCGSFYRHLQKALETGGHRCTRIAINGGDLAGSVFGRMIRYRRSLADWPHWISDLASRETVTDVICYGDCRPYHRAAIAALKPLGITVHVLEEGYLRPNWITCEADGVNGYSPLTRIDLDSIDGSYLEGMPGNPEVELKSTHWNYVLAGIGYYFWSLMLTPLFPRYQSHRDLDVVSEASLWAGRLVTWPAAKLRTVRILKTIARMDKPVHLALLQLNDDSQVKEHSPFTSTRHFAEFCISEFAASGAVDSILVFKNHPLDNGIIDIGRVIREAAARHGVGDRVFFLETGKLVPVLERAISVTAINSTACHQALMRGIPTMVLGKAVFNHPQIVAQGRLADFFRLRPCADKSAYHKFVGLMRATCQYNGGFYSRQGRDTLLPELTRALTEGARQPGDFGAVTAAETAPRKAS